MQNINYILVNDTNSENAAHAIHNSRVSDIRYRSTVVNAPRKWQVAGSKERTDIIKQLVFLRRHHPEAKILGLSEIDTSAGYLRIGVNSAMNQLRRDLSDMVD